jgi:hypothetical protein
MQRLTKEGPHIYMSPQERETWYEKLKDEYETNLSKYGVVFPAPDSQKALWLIFLRKNLGIFVHKDTISSFVHSVFPAAGKDQQVRHLAADGWYVLNRGDQLPDSKENVESGWHVLITTERPKPTFQFKSMKRAGRLSAKNFNQLKIVYDSRCATCGSQEGKPNLLEPDKSTRLQEGHMDPHKELTLDNTIPQCQVCNQIYQEDYVFDKKGRVVAVASVKPVLRADKNVKEEIKKVL